MGAVFCTSSRYRRFLKFKQSQRARRSLNYIYKTNTMPVKLLTAHLKDSFQSRHIHINFIKNHTTQRSRIGRRQLATRLFSKIINNLFKFSRKVDHVTSRKTRALHRFIPSCLADCLEKRCRYKWIENFRTKFNELH